MQSNIFEPPPARDAAPPSFEAAITDLRTTLAVCRADPRKNARVPQLIGQVARAAKADGMTPEIVVPVFREAWEREVGDQLRVTYDGRDLKLDRAITMLLGAYFADQRGDT